MSVVKYNCLKCGGSLQFKPETQKWKCDYCRGVFTLEELEKNTVKYENTKAEEHTELDVYKCNSCGAELIAKENEIISTCTYCRNSVIVKDKLVGKYLPTSIIPFSKTLEEVKVNFIKLCSKKKFIPKTFKNINNFDVRGIYVPFWLFDIEAEGNLIYKATRSHSHRSGDYIITDTKIYDCLRNGKARFERIPNDGSVQFDDALMNSIEPYNYSNLVEFNPGYLSGFQAEKYDVEKNQCESIVSSRARNTIENKFMETVKGYSSVSIKENNMSQNISKDEYCLLPAWLFDIEYKGKKYSFTMNGQTGKLVGNFPIDKLKVAITAILVFFGVAFLLTSLIAFGMM